MHCIVSRTQSWLHLTAYKYVLAFWYCVILCTLIYSLLHISDKAEFRATWVEVEKWNLSELGTLRFSKLCWNFNSGTTSKPNHRSTGGSVWFRLVSFVLNNSNCPELDGTAGEPPVNRWLSYEVAHKDHSKVPVTSNFALTSYRNDYHDYVQFIVPIQQHCV